MAETVEEARARIQTRAKVNFKGNALLNVSHLNYFKPLKVPDEVCKRCLVANEIITVNPLTSVVKVVGYMFLSNTPNKNLYNEDYRVWTYTTDDSKFNYIPTGKYPAIELKNITQSDRAGPSKKTRFYSTIKNEYIGDVISSTFEPMFLTSDYYSRDINNENINTIHDGQFIDVVLNNEGGKGTPLYIDVKNIANFCSFYKYEYEFIPNTDDIVEFYESLVSGSLWGNGVNIDFGQEKYTKRLTGDSVPELAFEGWSGDIKGTSYSIPEMQVYTLHPSLGFYSPYSVYGPDDINNISDKIDYFYRENNQYKRIYVKMQELKTSDYNQVKVKYQYRGEADETKDYREISFVPTIPEWNTNPTYYLSGVVIYKGMVKFSTDTDKFIDTSNNSVNCFPYFYLYGMVDERGDPSLITINDVRIDDVIGNMTGENTTVTKLYGKDVDIKIGYHADGDTVYYSCNYQYVYIDIFNKHIVDQYERARTSTDNNIDYSIEGSLYTNSAISRELLTRINHVYNTTKDKLGNDKYKAWTTLGVLTHMLCTGYRLYKVKMNITNTAIENVTGTSTIDVFNLPDLYPGKFLHNSGDPLEVLPIYNRNHNDNSYNILDWETILLPLISHIRIRINNSTVTLYSLGHFKHQYSVTTPDDFHNNEIYTASRITLDDEDNSNGYINEIKNKLYRYNPDLAPNIVKNVGLYDIRENVTHYHNLEQYRGYRPIVAILSLILTQFNVYNDLSFTRILAELLPGWREFINNDKAALSRMGVTQIKFTIHYGYSGFGPRVMYQNYTFNVSELNESVAKIFRHMYNPFALDPDF